MELSTAEVGSSRSRTQSPTTPRPLPARTIRTLPTPPTASSSKEKYTPEASTSRIKEKSPGSPSRRNKNSRTETLPPDYYAVHCSSRRPTSQQSYDRSPPPDYYAPHSTTSLGSPAADSEQLEEKSSRGRDVAPVESSKSSPQEELIHEEPQSSGARHAQLTDDVNRHPSKDPALPPLAPLRRQPDLESNSSSVDLSSSSHQKASKSSKRVSMIFRNHGHTASSSKSGSLASSRPDHIDVIPEEPGGSSRDSEPDSSSSHRSQSSDATAAAGKYPSPAKVVNILSHLNPPTASHKPNPSVSTTHSRDNLPYTSPYSKPSNGATVSYMLSSLAPAPRGPTSSKSGSKGTRSTSETQSSLSATSLTSQTSQDSSAPPKSRSQRQLEGPSDPNALPTGSFDVEPHPPRPFSPTNVAALVSSLFAPVTPIPPLAPLSALHSSTSLLPSGSEGPSNGSTGSHAALINNSPNAPATERVAAVSNILGGLAPTTSSSSNINSAPSSNPAGPPSQLPHQSHSLAPEPSNKNNLPVLGPMSVSALSGMLNPSNLWRPSANAKNWPPADLLPLDHSYSQLSQQENSPSSHNVSSSSTDEERREPHQTSLPSTSRAWTNPLLSLDSKLRPPLAVPKSRREEPVHAEDPSSSQRPLYSHLNALTPNLRPVHRSKSPHTDNSPKETKPSYETDAGGKKGATFSKLGSMFGHRKGDR